MATHVLTWHWGLAYAPYYVQRLASAVRRNTTMEYRFVCVCETPHEGFGNDVDVVVAIPDLELMEIKGCFCRLRVFDPLWQQAIGISSGDRIVIMDLDMIVVGNVDPILWRKEPFVILQGVNASNPCPYNGSLWSLRAGYRPDLWRDFSLAGAAKVPFDKFPDDQAYLAAKIPRAASYGVEDKVFAYAKPGWPGGTLLPEGARIVAFPGHRDPRQYTHLEWVRKNWLNEA